MLLIRLWLQNLIIYAESDPPRFIEVLMLLLGIVLLLIWGITEQWPFLGLSLSYVIGSSCSVLIRESLYPSPQKTYTQITAIMLLIVSIVGVSDLVYFY